MPTYDYRCDGCDHTFEQFQSITAEPLKKCPNCGARRLRRLIGTGGGILFRGEGFYQTDYRSDSYKKAAEAEKPAAAAKSSDKAAEATPAATSSAETPPKQAPAAGEKASRAAPVTQRKRKPAAP